MDFLQLVGNLFGDERIDFVEQVYQFHDIFWSCSAPRRPWCMKQTAGTSDKCYQVYCDYISVQ